MRMGKRILSALLSLVMATSLVTTSVGAAGWTDTAAQEQWVRPEYTDAVDTGSATSTVDFSGGNWTLSKDSSVQLEEGGDLHASTDLVEVIVVMEEQPLIKEAVEAGLAGDMSASAVHAAARRRGATVTEYLTAALIQAIRESRMDYGFFQARRPVTVSIPVNLRAVFPSRTLRNFFGVANVCVRLQEDMDFDDILWAVRQELQNKSARPRLEEMIAENVRLERNLAVKVVPLFLKKLILREAFNLRGENCKTITISNLGRLRLPEDMAAHVRRTRLVLYPTVKSPANCGVCTFGDILTFSFTRTILENDFIRQFFRFLQEDAGVEIEIHTNNWGYPNETM